MERQTDGHYYYIPHHYRRGIKTWFYIKVIIFVTYQPIVKFENCYVAIATFKWWISNKTTLETRKCCTGDECRVPESDQTWVTNKMTPLRNNKKLTYIDPFTITAVLH